MFLKFKKIRLKTHIKHVSENVVLDCKPLPPTPNVRKTYFYCAKYLPVIEVRVGGGAPGRGLMSGDVTR